MRNNLFLAIAVFTLGVPFVIDIPCNSEYALTRIPLILYRFSFFIFSSYKNHCNS